MNPQRFRQLEKEAFEMGEEEVQFWNEYEATLPTPQPVSKETLGFFFNPQPLRDMWKKDYKKLIKAATYKQKRDHKGLLHDEKPISHFNGSPITDIDTDT